MSVHIKRYLKSVKMNSSTSTYVNIDITYNKYVSIRALHTWGGHKQKDHTAQLECVTLLYTVMVFVTNALLCCFNAAMLKIIHSSSTTPPSDIRHCSVMQLVCLPAKVLHLNFLSRHLITSGAKDIMA